LELPSREASKKPKCFKRKSMTKKTINVHRDEWRERGRGGGNKLKNYSVGWVSIFPETTQNLDQCKVTIK